MTSNTTTEYHGYMKGTDTPCSLQVFRNPRRMQNRGTRWILFRESNGSSDGFRTLQGALAYGLSLNRNMEWRKIRVPKEASPETTN